MRALITSLALFGVLLIGIIINCIYVNRISEDLMLRAKEISTVHDESTISKLENLKKHFKKHESILLLSQSYLSVSKVDDCIDGAIAYAKLGDESGFQNTRAILISAIYDLSRLEKFSVKNIL